MFRYVEAGVKILQSLIASNALTASGVSLSSVYKLIGDISCLAVPYAPFNAGQLQPFPSLLQNQDGLHILQQGIDAYQARLDAELLSSSSVVAVVDSVSKNIFLNTVVDVADHNTRLVNAYYDLGRACYLYSRAQQLRLFSSLLSCEAAATQSWHAMLLRSRRAFVDGLRVDVNHSGCWNGLGLTFWRAHSHKDKAVAEAEIAAAEMDAGVADADGCSLQDSFQQSCFVRAAQLDSNSAAYNNLGVLLVQHGLFDESKDCFSAVQLQESNPMLWAVLGLGYELSASSRSSDVRNTDSFAAAFDAYVAALEIAKPVDAFVGAAVSWLHLHKEVLDENKNYDYLYPTDFVSRTRVELRYEVEGRVSRYLAVLLTSHVVWMLRAWCLEQRSLFIQAQSVLWMALQAVDFILVNLQSTPEETLMQNLEGTMTRKLRVIVQQILFLYFRCVVLVRCVGETGDVSDYCPSISQWNSLTKLPLLCGDDASTFHSPSSGDTIVEFMKTGYAKYIMERNTSSNFMFMIRMLIELEASQWDVQL